MRKKIKVAILSDMMDRPARGTALYARMLVENLLPLREGFDFELYLAHSKKNDDPLYRDAVEVMIPVVRIPKIGKILSEALFFIRSRKKFDIIHYPQESNYPLFWLSDAKIVLTVLSHIEGWKEYGLPIRYRLVDTTLRYFSKHIDAIICGSASSVKKSILSHYRIPESKITHTPLGVDDRFRHAPPYDDAMKRMREAYGIQGPYLLAPGRLDLQKNVPRIVEAYARVLKERPDVPRLIIGAKHRGDEDSKVADIIAREKLENNVMHLPYIEEADMPALYAGAVMTIFPSLHEGFGLPILESMASGTPVITSNVFSMPEVAGDAAILVNPLNVDEIKNAIVRMLDPKVRADLSQKGIAHSKNFSWSKMGRQVAEVYRSLLPR